MKGTALSIVFKKCHTFKGYSLFSFSLVSIPARIGVGGSDLVERR